MTTLRELETVIAQLPRMTLHEAMAAKARTMTKEEIIAAILKRDIRRA